ncbi:MAG: TonB-dependent receptor [Pseudomonadota bacterium]
MNGYNFKSRLLASSVFAGVAFGLVSLPAIAQEADEEAVQETVTVTGSRIQRLDFVSNSPISTVGAEQFELTGTVNTESLLNTLPQTIPGFDRTSNNPGNGTATVDLRGLGAQRTLVLVDGRRMVPTTQGGVVDINNIPAALIERVEVVTGGASAVYGSDAVSGVVNFILKDDFEGVEASAGYEVTQEGDAAIWSAALTLGGNFADDRGNAVLSLGYTNREELFQGDRDFSSVDNDEDGMGGFVAGGSSGIPEGRLTGPFDFPDGTSGAAFFNPDGSVRRFTGDDLFNFNPTNYLQLPQERFQLTGLADFAINDSTEVYASAIFANNEVPQQLAPTPIFEPRSGTIDFTLDGNPFLTPATQQILSGNNTNSVGIGQRVDRIFSAVDGVAQTGFVFDDDDNVLNQCLNCVFDSTAGDEEPNGFNDTAPLIDTDGDGIADLGTEGAFGIRRRLLEVGARRSEDEFNAFQIAFGIRGDLVGSWNYDIYYQEGRVKNTLSQLGNINVDRFVQALNLATDANGDVVLDAAGNPTCSDTTGGCAPINIFGLGNISPEAADFISTRVVADTDYEVTNFVANLSGDTSGLFELPGGPIGLAFGAEYREEFSAFRPSQDLATGTISGFNAAPPVEGGFDVYGIYGEAYLPILTDVQFADVLALELAYRTEDYTTAGTVESYKIAGEWAPVEQLRFRASYNTAVRAPSIFELFAPQGEGFPGSSDPCASDFDGDAALRTLCEATGVPASAVGSAGIDLPSGQVRQLSGGNPDLQAEEAETLTVGFVASPDIVPGLTFSVDYFDIEITDVISAFGGGANNVINTCYGVGDAEAAGVGSPFCNAITRGQSGLITEVSVTQQNVASLDVSGVDILADYDFDIGEYGAINIGYNATFTDENTLLPFEGGVPITCAGEFGDDCDDPIPEYKHRVTTRWSNGPLTAQLLWRYIGSTQDDDEGTVFAVEEIDGFNYFDISGSYQVNDTLTLTGGIDNLLDEEPAILGENQEQANTYPATYDVFGRTFFVRATARF